MPELKLDIAQAEEYTGFSRYTIRTAIRNGALKAYTPAGMQRQRIYFERADLDAWLADAATSVKKAQR